MTYPTHEQLRSATIPQGPEAETLRRFNPTRDGAWLHFGDDAPKHIAVFDALGRMVFEARGVSSLMQYLDMSDAAKGLFWVRVSDGVNVKTRKLLIH